MRESEKQTEDRMQEGRIGYASESKYSVEQGESVDYVGCKTRWIIKCAFDLEDLAKSLKKWRESMLDGQSRLEGLGG